MGGPQIVLFEVKRAERGNPSFELQLGVAVLGFGHHAELFDATGSIVDIEIDVAIVIGRALCFRDNAIWDTEHRARGDLLRAFRDPFGCTETAILNDDPIDLVMGPNGKTVKDIGGGGSPLYRNGFSWHAVDMIIDNDLDIFLVGYQHGISRPSSSPGI